MNLLPRDTQPAVSPSGVDYVFGVFIWLISAGASLLLAIFGVGYLFVGGLGSQFGYEFLPCFAAPVIASITFAVALARSTIRPFPPRIVFSGALAIAVGSVVTLLGYLLLSVFLPNAKGA